jgi:hypothetical protein
MMSIQASGSRLQAHVFALLLALLLPATAAAQYAPDRSHVVRDVANAHPGLVLRDHEFTNRVVLELRARYPQDGWCRNAKRGNFADPSHDAIWMPDSRSPIGGSIIDIIGSAGASNASPAWIDQTAETIRQGTRGGCIEPSGAVPPPLVQPAPGGGPPPIVVPPPTAAAVEAQIALLAAQVHALRGELDASRRETQQQRDSLYHLIADILIAEHVGSLYERLEAIRGAVER